MPKSRTTNNIPEVNHRVWEDVKRHSPPFCFLQRAAIIRNVKKRRRLLLERRFLRAKNHCHYMDLNRT